MGRVVIITRAFIMSCYSKLTNFSAVVLVIIMPRVFIKADYAKNKNVGDIHNKYQKRYSLLFRPFRKELGGNMYSGWFFF